MLGCYPKYLNVSYNSTKTTKKKQQYNFKMAIKLELTFFKRRYTDGQQEFEKILNISNHQRLQIKTTM